MTQITILNQDNVPQGPFTRSEVTQRLQTGEFTMGSLAFIEGLGQWTPLRDVLARVDAAMPLQTGAAAPAFQPPTAQPYSYAATMQPPPHLVYAGFWLRFVAYFIDSLIVGFVIGILSLPFGLIAAMLPKGTISSEYSSGSLDAATGLMAALAELVFLAVLMLITWLYFAMMESGKSQATLGKKVVGLKVTNLAGERLGFGQASGRFFGKIISGMIFDIGFIMAAFTEKKQALHDMIAGTLVVKG